MINELLSTQKSKSKLPDSGRNLSFKNKFISTYRFSISTKLIQIFRKLLYGLLITTILVSFTAKTSILDAKAQEILKLSESSLISTITISGNSLSNGQFVYGPNIRDFNLEKYIEEKAPHLAQFSTNLNSRLDYYSINPRVFLTLLEVNSHLVTNPDPAAVNDPFGLKNGDFFSQSDEIFNILVNAYYLHLYTYSSLPVLTRNLPSLISLNGNLIEVAPETNAGTYAIITALARIEDEENIAIILDNTQPDGFFLTYKRLFPDDDPISEANHIFLPGEINALAAPNELLQLPYPTGESWKFNGVHDSMGGVVGSAFVNAASIDFGPFPT